MERLWRHVSVQTGQASAFGFGRTYVLPLDAGSVLPRMPPGGLRTEAEIAAIPGVEICPMEMWRSVRRLVCMRSRRSPPRVIFIAFRCPDVNVVGMRHPDGT